MAPYTPVPNVNTGDTWSASQHNQYIRDNFAAGVPDIIEAKGDLAVGTGPDAAARLPVGANNHVLKANSAQPTGLEWVTPAQAVGGSFSGKGQLVVGTGSGTASILGAGADGLLLVADSSSGGGMKWGGISRTIVTRNSDYTPGAGTTAISWQTESVDAGGMWTGANPTRLTIPTTGHVYMIGAAVNVDLTGGDPLSLILRKNGTTIIYNVLRGMDVAGTAKYTMMIPLTYAWGATAGDYFEVLVATTSGAVKVYSNYSSFFAYRVG